MHVKECTVRYTEVPRTRDPKNNTQDLKHMKQPESVWRGAEVLDDCDKAANVRNSGKAPCGLDRLQEIRADGSCTATKPVKLEHVQPTRTLHHNQPHLRKLAGVAGEQDVKQLLRLLP